MYQFLSLKVIFESFVDSGKLQESFEWLYGARSPTFNIYNFSP